MSTVLVSTFVEIPPMPAPYEASPAESLALAYQRVRLQELRQLYEQLDLDLARKLQEARPAEAPQGMQAAGRGEPTGGQGPSLAFLVQKKSGPPAVDDLCAEAQAYLAGHGVDLNRDPLVQFLGPGAAEYAANLADADAPWFSADYLTVLLAGLAGTLLDILVLDYAAGAVEGARGIGRVGEQAGGALLTRWLRGSAALLHGRYGHYFRDLAPQRPVPAEGEARSKIMRIVNVGRDPLLAFIIGSVEAMRGAGLDVNPDGDLVVLRQPGDQLELTEAFLKVFWRLVVEVFTGAGLHPLPFGLFELAKTGAAHATALSGEEISWSSAARELCGCGYDPRRFLKLGLVPGCIETALRAWCYCRDCEDPDKAGEGRGKLASMILLAQAIAASGSLVKTGVLADMDPEALDWATLLARLPLVLAWVRESYAGQAGIRERLDAEWSAIHPARRQPQVVPA